MDFLFRKQQNKRKIIKNDVEFEYTKIRGAKSINIIIKSPYKVKVTLPIYGSYNQAEKFVTEKMFWIEEKLNSLSSNLINENFETKTGNFKIFKANVDNPIIKKKKETIEFIYPENKNIYEREIQLKAALALKKALYIQAQTYLPKRLKELAEKFGFKYNKVALKSCKTRWGSCSFSNNINLNINLTQLQDKYIDYVLLHELCHTIEKNHGKNFWTLLEKCMPDAKLVQKELKTLKVPFCF